MSNTIFKVKHYRNFTTVSNDWINSPELSAKAKGILLYLLSKPNNWETNLLDIISHMRDGVDSIKAGIKELKTTRHIVKASIRDAGGKITGWETLVFEEPLPEVEKPPSGFSTNWENHQLENPPQLNTKELNTDLDLEELNTDQELNTKTTKSQNCSAAIADAAILAKGGIAQVLREPRRTAKAPEAFDETDETQDHSLSGMSGSEETQSSKKSSKKKKQAKSRKFMYLEVFRDDEAMKQDFVALYRAHPKHTCAKQSAEAYFRLRQAGITAEEILVAHRAALGDAWRGRTVQLHPKLGDWLADVLANRDLGIGSDRAPLPSAEQYDQVRAQYFQVCVELDAPFGDEELAQAMWRVQGADPQNLDGIVEATPYYLEKKRKREGEPICRFERYLQHRWQVVLAHKRLRTDSTVSGVAARSFIDWFNLATSVRVIQAFSSSDSGMTRLPTGSIGVRLTGEDCWQDWRAIAQHYSVERLQRLKSESEQSLS
jgi:hypothetical protein